MNNQPQIDFSQSTEVLSEDGKRLFQTGYVIRRISKFLMGTEEDIIIPIQVFFDEKGNIVKELLQPDLRELYDSETI